MRPSTTKAWKRTTLALAGAAVLHGCANFHPVVTGQVYRSAQPGGDDAVRWLDRIQARTLVFLRNGEPGVAAYDASKGGADALGVAFVQVPLSSRTFPDRERLLALWEVFETAERPILLHCLAGSDRTGLAAALAVLHATGDPVFARRQFAFAPFLHTGLKGAWRMPAILDAYARCPEPMGFPDWVRRIYDPVVLESTAGRGDPPAAPPATH